METVFWHTPPRCKIIRFHNLRGQQKGVGQNAWILANTPSFAVS